MTEGLRPLFLNAVSYQNELHYTTDKLSGFERLRVDPDQTSFWEGREFRTFKELSIAGSAEYVIKAVVPINIIVVKVEVAIEAGFIRVGTYVGGTAGGSFSETLPIINANNQSAGVNRRNSASGILYTVQTDVTAGGTHTGGTELDVVRLKAASVTVQAQSVGSSPFDQRGVAANTYYFRLLNLSAMDTITGTFKVRWEERPSGFFQT